ncbi:MAG: peptidylprolyl isomerase [Acetobacteraceae bacterium]
MLATAAEATGADLKNTVYMDLKYGRVVIELHPELAPKNVAQVEKLIRAHFYDGTPFWRVIAGFMAQGGDPTGTGTGGSKLADLPAEFTGRAEFLRGTVGMARTNDPNSANSQFFICLAPATFLDGKYTIIGQVVQGMQYVDEIKKGGGQNGKVTDPDRIIRMRMADQASN